MNAVARIDAAIVPFAAMLFRLVRLRFAKLVGRLAWSLPVIPAGAAAAPCAPRLELEV